MVLPSWCGRYACLRAEMIGANDACVSYLVRFASSRKSTQFDYRPKLAAAQRPYRMWINNKLHISLRLKVYLSTPCLLNLDKVDISACASVSAG